MLAERSGLSPTESFGYLRGHARATQQTMTVVATAIIEGRLSFDQLRVGRTKHSRR